MTLSSVESRVKKMNAKKECCTSYDTLNYSELDAENTLKFDMSTEEVLNIDSVKSYFLAFDIGAAKDIHVYTLLEDGLTSNYVFWPTIALLDEKYEVQRKLEPKSFSANREEDCTHYGMLSIFWGKMIKIKENEKYMVIYTEQNFKQHDAMLTKKRPSNLCLPDAIWPITDSRSLRAQHSPDGEIWVKVQ